jgi:hypothetical protein
MLFKRLRGDKHTRLYPVFIKKCRFCYISYNFFCIFVFNNMILKQSL